MLDPMAHHKTRWTHASSHQRFSLQATEIACGLWLIVLKLRWSKLWGVLSHLCFFLWREIIDNVEPDSSANKFVSIIKLNMFVSNCSPEKWTAYEFPQYFCPWSSRRPFRFSNALDALSHSFCTFYLKKNWPWHRWGPADSWYQGSLQPKWARTGPAQHFLLTYHWKAITLVLLTKPPVQCWRTCWCQC